MFLNTSRHHSWVHTPRLIFALYCHECVPCLCTFMSFLDLFQCHQGLKKRVPVINWTVRVRHETGCLHVLTWPAVCFIVGGLFVKDILCVKSTTCQLIALVLPNITEKKTRSAIWLQGWAPFIKNAVLSVYKTMTRMLMYITTNLLKVISNRSLNWHYV